ncbi:Cytochrome P450 [Mycena venus]|uniref:Cytochrome P450 n=1 Tax=Mycena venus TaxID=2733690 RepID=A0A8H6Y4P6_9AGAR|nr:Cytochrome P450 [Mycena venus]
MDPSHYAIPLAPIIFFIVIRLVFRRQNTLRHVAGPPSPSWIFGHILQLILPPQYGDYEFRWQDKFGPVYRIKGCFGEDRLLVADPAALQYILNSPNFERGGAGKEHRRMRAALNFGFSAAAVRRYQAVFEKAAEMVSEKLEGSLDTSTNVCPLLSLATLRAISEACLRYTLEDLGNDFVANNIEVMRLSASRSAPQLLLDALSLRFPLWLLRATAKYLPTSAFKAMREGRYLAENIGHRIIRERVDAAHRGVDMDDDLFSHLLDPDVPNNMHLSKKEVVSQVGLLLVAGQDTTANTMAYALLELARNPEFQAQLRNEIHSTLGTSGGGIAYDSMPLLNALIKETNRFYPAAPLLDRVATKDTTLPLAQPIITTTGEQISHIPILKGQFLTLGIGSYQRLKSHWGADAHKFNPHRWLDGTVNRGDAVGIGPYANLLSFSGGLRTCLGWRFSILEMQVILSHLVGRYSFAEVVEETIRPTYLNNLLPIVQSGERAVPLYITRI